MKLRVNQIENPGLDMLINKNKKMKTFQMFQEDLSKNTIPLDKTSQKNLSNARKGQTGPASKPAPQASFKLVPLNIPMK